MSALTGVPWVAVAISDIQAARPGALVAAFQGTALAVGQSDPSLVIIQKCTTELLSAIGYSGRVVMDASQGQNGSVDVVPPNMFDVLVEKICRVMEKRLGMAWTADEQADDRAYQKTLQGLMAGTVSVYATSNPGNAASISAKGGAVAQICAPPRQFQPGPSYCSNGTAFNGGYCGGNPL